MGASATLPPGRSERVCVPTRRRPADLALTATRPCVLTLVTDRQCVFRVSGLHSSQEYYTRKRGLVVPHVRLEVERNFFSPPHSAARPRTRYAANPRATYAPARVTRVSVAALSALSRRHRHAWHAAYEQYTHPGQTRRLKRVAHGVALLAARRHTRLSQFEKGGVTLKPKITQAWLHS